mgnify:FL=1|tara:strand:+ start:92 stop:679 length:588 start_codon:yes stop_codon:yes gene_type:complete
MEKPKKIPLVYLTIDDDDESGVDFVSLVDEPAIERDFMAFSKIKEPYKFKIENQEKRIITGPFMISNLPIYRRIDDKEWYVVFTSDVIRKIVYKFMKNGLTKAVNEMHETPVDDVFIFESWIVDDVKGVPEGFQDVPQGSWFGSMRIENDEVWQKIKEDDGYMLKGFSVEGIFREDKEMTMDQEVIDAVIDAIQK